MPDNLIVLDRDFTLLEDGYLVQRNVGGEFVLQTVYLNELTVELLLVLVETVEFCFPLLVLHIQMPFQTIGSGWGWVYTTSLIVGIVCNNVDEVSFVDR